MSSFQGWNDYPMMELWYKDDINEAYQEIQIILRSNEKYSEKIKKVNEIKIKINHLQKLLLHVQNSMISDN